METFDRFSVEAIKRWFWWKWTVYGVERSKASGVEMWIPIKSGRSLSRLAAGLAAADCAGKYKHLLK